MNKKIILAYTAGFVDGEGSIGISKRLRKHWKPEYHIFLSVGQKDGETLDWMKDNFGGNVYLIKRDGSFMWALSNKKAYEFIVKIEPYLQYKKPQAKLAIKFYKEQIIANVHRNRATGLSEEEINKRESMLQEMKMLKKVFIKSTYC